MTTKQVTATPAATAPANTPNNGSNTPTNVYIKVLTFDKDGKTVGERIVDMYHIGTAGWLYSKHLWWAMHQDSFTVEIAVAGPQEIEDYLARGKEALAAKFNVVEQPADVVVEAA